MPPSPPPQDEAEANGSVTGADDVPSQHDSETIDTDEDAHLGRHLRRGGDRAAERQRKREELVRRKEAEAAAKAPKQSKEFVRLLKDIQKREELVRQCEDEIATIDNDLRENDCPRTRTLGKDRFWNRYYWFERNGMPYAGLPTSSTAEAGYANGCLWVQGPDELEREGYIDMEDKWQDEYKAKFNMTVPERKAKEEGATSVYNARQWGYFSEPEDVDSLIKWLDTRGYNEAKLRKELLAFRDQIIVNMKARKQYLGDAAESVVAAAAAAAEAEGKTVNGVDAAAAAEKTAAKPNGHPRDLEDDEEEQQPHKRMRTRTRAVRVQQLARTTTATPEPDENAVPEPAAPKVYRCLAWENTTALKAHGHLHSEAPPPPRPRKQTKKKMEAAAVDLPTVGGRRERRTR